MIYSLTIIETSIEVGADFGIGTGSPVVTTGGLMIMQTVGGH